MTDGPTPIGGSSEELDDRIDREREILRAQIQYLETIGQTAKVIEERIKLEDKLFDKQQEQADVLDRINNAVLANDDAAKQAAQNELKNIEKKIIQQKALNDSLNLGAKAATDFSKAIFGVGDAPNTALGRLAASAMKAKEDPTLRKRWHGKES